MKKLLLLIFVSALFAPTIYVEITLPAANAVTIPKETLQDYKLYSDGGGSTTSIHWDGIKFTLTENIEATITLMDDGIIIDGAGFTVKGKGDSVGIAVYDKNSVIIKNLKVEKFYIGILLGHNSSGSFLWYDPNPNRPTNCTISNCQTSNNTQGIYLTGGIKCRIIGNQVTNNEVGITFSGSENYFRNNQMDNNRINFADTTYGKNDIDLSNTINGKPIYYIVNQQDITVPADASIVYLEGCSNVVVHNLEIKHAHKAISLLNSSNCKIYGNTLLKNEIGIMLSNSNNNSIIGNKLLNNSDYSIKNYDSENNTIANNLIKTNGGGIDSTGYGAGSLNTAISSNQIIANIGHGIQAGTETTITGNYLEGNGQHGIYFWDISNSIIHKNIITQNEGSGVCCRKAVNASITGNDISKNKIGIEMGDVMDEISMCIITENNFVQNSNHAVIAYCDLKDNHFYLNNFIDNNGSVQVSIKGRFVWKGDEGYNASSNVFPQYVTSYNAWDNGLIGNYWSDNNSTDGNAYKISDQNIDHYPLLSPVKFNALELPSTEVPQELLGTQQQETETRLLAILVLTIVLPVIAIIAVILIFKKIKKR